VLTLEVRGNTRALSTPVSAAVILVTLVACHTGAERVDVPLRTSVTDVTLQGSTNSHLRSFLAFDMSITNEGDRDVVAMDCRATARDAQARELFSFPLPTFVGGTDVPQGQTVAHSFDHWRVSALPKTVATVVAYQAICQAYVWHGERPS
jgi:hypothetical protein